MKNLTMRFNLNKWLAAGCLAVSLGAIPAQALPAGLELADPHSSPAENTSFQTALPWSPRGDLQSDVAMVYGIDPAMPSRVATWRQHGYQIHVMTGVAWGEYQDYLYGRFDGINHEDEAQTDRDGNKIGHGGDVYYMSPGTNYGKFLCVGVQRALDAGARAIELEEPEFWDRAGYSEGFKREWAAYYHEAWQPPDGSVDARWRAGRLKYYLYRRALQQVFDYVQAYNQRTGAHVRCHVATHSLLNYAQWCIVSPESSLARVQGCDGYIAQIWTGTSREPNRYVGEVRSRTFETAFLEYGAMQNLVRATGRAVWYLNDPIEDNPNHDWTDYRQNWESTLTASLFQPDVHQYEVAPWPERVFGGRYPRSAPPEKRQPIPPDYATELQIVFNALNHMDEPSIAWSAGTTGIGVMVSDSLMFQRGQPTPSDPYLGNFYGLAMPLVMKGVPVTPVQLENVIVSHYLDPFRVLFLSYDGQKPLSPEVHPPLVDWVKKGGILVFCDRDADPYLQVREWWNEGANHYDTPRCHLFELLGLRQDPPADTLTPVGRGAVLWVRERPADLTTSPEGAARVVSLARRAAEACGLKWQESTCLQLRRGPYVIAGGLDQNSTSTPRHLSGRFVNLFDPRLQVLRDVSVTPGSRWFLLDLDAESGIKPTLLASGCRAVLQAADSRGVQYRMEGVGHTQAIALFACPHAPLSVTLDGVPISSCQYDPGQQLLWVHFENDAAPHVLAVLLH